MDLNDISHVFLYDAKSGWRLLVLSAFTILYILHLDAKWLRIRAAFDERSDALEEGLFVPTHSGIC